MLLLLLLQHFIFCPRRTRIVLVRACSPVLVTFLRTKIKFFQPTFSSSRAIEAAILFLAYFHFSGTAVKRTVDTKVSLYVHGRPPPPDRAQGFSKNGVQNSCQRKSDDDRQSCKERSYFVRTEYYADSNWLAKSNSEPNMSLSEKCILQNALCSDGLKKFVLSKCYYDRKNKKFFYEKKNFRRIRTNEKYSVFSEYNTTFFHRNVCRPSDGVSQSFGRTLFGAVI